MRKKKKRKERINVLRDNKKIRIFFNIACINEKMSAKKVKLIQPKIILCLIEKKKRKVDLEEICNRVIR